jgi:hypothetical protein
VRTPAWGRRLMGNNSRRRSWRVSGGGALAGSWFLAVTMAGCASSAPPSPTPHTPLVTVPAPPPAARSGDPAQQARLAYLGMWTAFVQASHTADYQSPALARYAAGGALSVLVHGLYANYQNGIVTRGKPVFHPEVTVATRNGQPFQANVTDCADSSHWLDYYRSGKAVSESAPGRRRIIAQLQPFSGVWKVTYLNVGKEGTC